FVTGEGDQFFTVTFYVLHLRDAPTDEIARHVDRAVVRASGPVISAHRRAARDTNLGRVDDWASWG
ncbi:MAG: hypothetical protein ABW318_01625, partial [Vicinamibacterales bacterium]